MTGPTLTGGRCECRACNLFFGSEDLFNRHRTGSYAQPGELKGNRRCLTPAEMEARGWFRSARGFWIRKPREAGPLGLQAPRMTPPATHVPGA